MAIPYLLVTCLAISVLPMHIKCRSANGFSLDAFRDPPRKALQECSWLRPCYCRDESIFTNGSYKLMVNCTQAIIRGLRDIPTNIPSNTTVLTLDGNNISKIPYGAFNGLSDLKYLDLSGNLIETLDRDTFKGLSNLKTLEVSANRIRYLPSTIPPEVFRSLSSLERLNIHQQLPDLNNTEVYPTDALVHLKKLRQLLIDGPENQISGTNFSELTELRMLDFQSQYGRCKINTIKTGMFRNLTSINVLMLNNCSINYIEMGSFKELQNLLVLDLSHNENLEFKSLPNLTHGLQTLHIKELKLNKIHKTFGDCTKLNADHLQNFRNMTIDDLYLNSNRLAYITEDAVEHIPRNIQKLSLINNMLLAGDYLRKIFDGSIFDRLKYLTLAEQNSNHDILQTVDKFTKVYLQNLNIQSKKPTNAGQYNIYRLDNNRNATYIHKDQQKTILKIYYLSNGSVIQTDQQQKEPEMNLNYDSNNSTCANCLQNKIKFNKVFFVPESLNNIDLSGLQIRNELKSICVCEPNSITRIELQRNVFWNWQGPIFGLSNLKRLDLSLNSCNNLSVDVFDRMTDLLELNLTQNFIERFLRHDTEGRIFRELKNLDTLYLSGVQLTYLPPNVFSGLEKLTGIDLSFNFFTQIDVTFNPSTNLEYIDLNGNILTKVGPTILAKLDEDVKRKRYAKTYLVLSNNKLSCKCDDIEFVRWIKTTHVTLEGFDDYKCTFENGEERSVKMDDEMLMQLHTICANYTVLIVASLSGVFFFLIIIVGGVLYRYRWNLRYLYYSVKLRVNGYTPQILRNEDCEFTYDAFISYASDSSKFVKDELVPALERDRNLQLLVHDRDFRAGEFVNDNIMEAITKSRKTLILMNKKFLKSGWCIFEMNMARMESIKTGRNLICLIMMEEVNPAGLPLEIIDIIRKQTYLALPDDEAFMDVFWDRVYEALK